MPKPRTSYVCAACGERTSQWQGQCPSLRGLEHAGGDGVGGPHRHGAAWRPAPAVDCKNGDGDHGARPTTAYRPASANSIACSAADSSPDRRSCSVAIPGSASPRVLLQAADALSRERAVLYASGEESVRQVALRARRLGLGSTSLRLARRDPRRGDTRGRRRPPRRACSSSIRSRPCRPRRANRRRARPSQVRESAARLVRYAKDTRRRGVPRSATSPRRG